MKRRTCWTVVLAAGIWGSIGEPAASPEYRKDPAVRAALEEKLKTSDAAEIRRRWGAFADLADKVWIHQRQGSETRTWFHLRWRVPGAVMEYALGHCPARACDVRKAVLVHKPAAAPAPDPAPSSESFSLSGLSRAFSSLTSLVNPDSGRPGFDVLWEDGGDAAGVVLESGVKMDGYEYEYDAAKAEVSVRGTVYKATTPAELAAATGYALAGVTAPKPATAETSLRTAEYRKDPAVQAAVEEKLKTSDAAEIRRRWGLLVELMDKGWVHSASSGRGRGVVHLRWVVSGAVIEFTAGACTPKCDLRKALLVHNPGESVTWSLTNFLKEPAFDVLWEDGQGDSLGVNHGTFVQLNKLIYKYDTMRTQVVIDGSRYSAMAPAEFAALAGLAPAASRVAEQAKEDNAKPAAPAVREIVPVVAKGTVRGGFLGAEIAGKDPARPLEGPQVLQSVQPNGPAASAGLVAGDVIESIGGIERPSQGDVLRTILSAPEQVVPIVAQRNGQSIARSVKLGERMLPGPCFVLGLTGYQYAGECKDGFAHGRGELSYQIQIGGKPTLARYSGEFARGYMEGRGTVATAMVTYEGQLAGHLRHGRGKLTYADGRPGFEGPFEHNKVVGLKAVAEAVVVCTRPDGSGKFECDTPQRAGVAGGPGAKGRPESPQALLASVAQSCPSQRRLPSRTHLVWGCGFGATSAPGAVDRGTGVEMRGRGSYQCLEREATCKRTDPI